MARRSHTKPVKRTHRAAHHKTIGYSLKIYFLFVFIGVVVYSGGMGILKSRQPCANSGSCTSDLTEKIENGAVGIFEGHKIMPPPIDVAADAVQPSVLGTNDPNAGKHIYIDLSSQTLYAFEGADKIFQTYVSTGRWNRTPVGNFHIWTKLRSTRMSGGQGAAAYNLPNVPFVMYFYRDFGLHGAYWHNNFGYTMSHGCVNMRQIDAETVFNWADGPSPGRPGTAVSTCNSFSAPDICTQINPVN